MTAKGMQAAIEAIEPGVTDNHVAAAAYEALISAGSEFMALDPVVTTGTRSGVPHTTHRRITIKQGDPSGSRSAVAISGTPRRSCAPCSSVGRRTKCRSWRMPRWRR